MTTSTSTGSPKGRRWWSAAPEPALPPIGSRRAYTEVLLVYLAFFAAGIVAAGLLLANHYADVSKGASWSLYMTQTVDIVCQIGLAVAVVVLVAARRQVSAAALGLSVPRQADGRLAVSRTIRIAAWCFFAIIVGSIINAVLQTGELPNRHVNAPELIFSMVDSVQAGVIEELVVLAFVVVTLRQARRPWWEVAVVALVLRGAYHIYYGPGVLGILVWAALFYWIYLRFRQLWPLIVCHALWDAVAFGSRATLAVAGIGEILVAVLWITAIILWLVERNNRSPQLPAGYGYGYGYGYTGTGWPPGGGYGQAGPATASGPAPAAVPAPAAGPAPAWPGNGSWPPTVPGHPPEPSTGAAPAAVAPPAAPSGPAPGPNPPPGWHPDPAGHNRWRWWDGYRWTDYVSPHS